MSVAKRKTADVTRVGTSSLEMQDLAANAEGGSANAQAPRRVVWVKKNLIDQTAALSYSMGVSIVHLSMFISLQFVKHPDMSKIAGLSENC